MEYIEVSAKTVDDAVTEALIKLGATSDQFEYEVVEKGSIGFLGLVAPHIARRLVGPKHIKLIPTAALIGTLILLVGDTISRNIIAPMEIPVGIVVAIIGVPYFIYLMLAE